LELEKFVEVRAKHCSIYFICRSVAELTPKAALSGSRTNVGVGTLAGLFDVVSNGATDPLWQKKANEQFMLGPEDSTVTFFLQMMQGIPNDTQFIQSISTTSSNEHITTLSTNFPSVPVLLNASLPLQLVATTSTCDMVGTTQLGISLNLGDGYVPITFYFLKKCGSTLHSALICLSTCLTRFPS
jgi:hypothetical protein